MAIHSIGGYRVTDQVLSAVREASDRTGVDFSYMMAKAAQESGFQPDAHAPNSSATGLYQFIDSTWLGMVKAHGAEHGLGAYADKITERPDGGLTVADPAARREILALRNDPRLNALMAGEYANDNRDYLESTVGGQIGTTELYLAHFLGAGGAATFLRGMRANPDQPAANLFPEAAAANQGVFYDRQTGSPRSLRQVHAWLAQRIDRGTSLAGNVPEGADSGTATDQRAAAVSAVPRLSEFALMHPLSAVGSGPLAAGGAALGERQLSLWAVLTASSLPVPSSDGRNGVPTAAPRSPTATPARPA